MFVSVCVHRDVQLVRGLLHSNCWCGSGGEPDGLSGWEGTEDAAEPSRGALPQRLEVSVHQHALCGQRGRLPSWPTLTVCCSINTLHSRWASRLLLSLELYFTCAKISWLYCVNKHGSFYCCFLTCLPLSVYICCFTFSFRKCFLFSVSLTMFLCELRRRGTGSVQFISMPGAFCIFSFKMLVPSFNTLVQEIKHFQRWIHYGHV